MELRQLSHFLAVAEERHFTRAADRVHLTQSSLSSSIRALERELGCELFVRSTRQVDLTEAGRALLPSALRSVAAAEEGRDAVAGVRRLLRGKLTLGAIQTQTFGMVSVPAVLARYHRRHPAVTIRMHQAGVPELVRRTADGELELAFVDLPLGPQGSRVRAEPLGREALQLAVRVEDRLAQRRRIRLVDVADHDFVEYRPDSSLRTSIDAACNAVGLKRRIVCEVDTVADLIDVVAQGLGVSLLPPGAVRISGGRLAGIETDPPIPRELAFVTAQERDPSPAARAFLTLLREDLASEAPAGSGP